MQTSCSLVLLRTEKRQRERGHREGRDGGTGDRERGQGEGRHQCEQMLGAYLTQGPCSPVPGGLSLMGLSRAGIQGTQRWLLELWSIVTKIQSNLFVFF